MTGRQPRNPCGETNPNLTPSMKASKLLLAAAAFASLATLSLAGPGPEYWARMKQNQKPASPPSIQQTKAQTAAKPAAEVATACTACQGCAKKS